MMRTRKSNKRIRKTRSKRQRGGTNNNIEASHEGYTEIVADVDAKIAHGMTALMEASRLGNEKTATELLKNGAKVDMIDDEGWSALIWASANGHTGIVKELLKNGANVNAKSYTGISALHLASNNGHTELVRELLENGADVSAKTKNGDTALMWASEKSKHTEIEELLKNAIETDKKRQDVMEEVRVRDREIPSLRTLAYRQLPTSTTTEINKVNDWLLPPSKLGENRRTKRSKKKTRKTHKK
jgi:ankyrin repeat protein